VLEPKLPLDQGKPVPTHKFGSCPAKRAAEMRLDDDFFITLIEGEEMIYL